MRNGIHVNLCPGYFQRDDQELIERNGPGSAKFYCALCGQEVKPVQKDGGWLPKNHKANPMYDRVDSF
jgi:hypothetical protein